MKISLVNNEVEIPLEKQLMEKMTKQFENFFVIKHSNKDNILTGANNINVIKEFMVKKLKIDDFKTQGADVIKNKINIVNENKDKFIEEEEEEENNENENNVEENNVEENNVEENNVEENNNDNSNN